MLPKDTATPKSYVIIDKMDKFALKPVNKNNYLLKNRSKARTAANNIKCSISQLSETGPDENQNSFRIVRNQALQFPLSGTGLGSDEQPGQYISGYWEDKFSKSPKSS